MARNHCSSPLSRCLTELRATSMHLIGLQIFQLSLSAAHVDQSHLLGLKYCSECCRILPMDSEPRVENLAFPTQLTTLCSHTALQCNRYDATATPQIWQTAKPVSLNEPHHNSIDFISYDVNFASLSTTAHFDQHNCGGVIGIRLHSLSQMTSKESSRQC